MNTLLVDEGADRVVVTLNRPDKRNAIDARMVDELHAVCELLEREPRILILTGSDGVFASGADIAELRERTAIDARRSINATIFSRIAALPMPVIAAVDGYALGGGAELAYAADFRIGTPRLRIGNPETGLGIIARHGTHVVVPEFDAELVLDLFEREHANMALLVPTMLIRMLDHPSFLGRDMSSVHTLVSGAATVPAELIRRTISTRPRGVPLPSLRRTSATPTAATTGPIRV